MEDETRGGSESGGACAVSKDAGKRNRRHRSSRLRQKNTQQQQQQTTMTTTANGAALQSSSSQGDETADSSSSVDGSESCVNKTMPGGSSPSNGSSSSGACGEGLRRIGSAKGGVLFNLDESSTSNEENTEAEEEIGPLGGRQPSLSSQASLDAVSAAAAAIMTDPALHTPKMR
ncbi:hypothetical protein RRG08_034619 [Elysia crispata]|uniref:Uncharacterized protein n=1 Tax=Elysia crispata TaxID=231223 RepID=A0AAE1E8B0_9GAST|nr:hypothetical protein RRG08_034619 [Elysia crispata]